MKAGRFFACVFAVALVVVFPMTGVSLDDKNIQPIVGEVKLGEADYVSGEIRQSVYSYNRNKGKKIKNYYSKQNYIYFVNLERLTEKIKITHSLKSVSTKATDAPEKWEEKPISPAHFLSRSLGKEAKITLDKKTFDEEENDVSFYTEHEKIVHKGRIDKMKSYILAFFNFDDRSFRNGDVLESLDLSRIIPFLSEEIPITLLGKKEYGGRSVLVGRSIDNFTYKGAQIPVKYLCYIDMATGTTLYSLFELSVLRRGKKLTEYSNESEFVLSEARGVRYPQDRRSPTGAGDGAQGSSAPSLGDIETKCVELGFTKGTEKFGDCVMKLYR